MVAALPNSRIKDLRGKVFSRVTVIQLDPRDRKKGTFWACKCSCGVAFSVLGTQLTSKTTKSCGCLRRELRTKHGLHKTPEFRIWYGVIERCYNIKLDSYPRYGGRGIFMCPKWKNDFSIFYKDMGPRPNNKMTIERIDNSKGYYKDNCRWATKKEQGRNRRDNHIIVYKGEKLILSEFVSKHVSSFTYEAVRNRLNRGLSPEQIVNTPKHARKSRLLAEKKFE